MVLRIRPLWILDELVYFGEKVNPCLSKINLAISLLDHANISNSESNINSIVHLIPILHLISQVVGRWPWPILKIEIIILIEFLQVENKPSHLGLHVTFPLLMNVFIL